MNLAAWGVSSCVSQSPEKYLLLPNAHTEHVSIQNITSKAAHNVKGVQNQAS